LFELCLARRRETEGQLTLVSERQEERVHPPHIRGRPWRGWMFLSFFLCAKEIRIFLVKKRVEILVKVGSFKKNKNVFFRLFLQKSLSK
jgi:hypothetical protein